MHDLGFSLQTWASNTKQNKKSTSSTLEISKLHVRNVARSTNTGQFCFSLLQFSEGRCEIGSSHSLPPQDLFLPTSLPHGGTFVCVGADLITMSLFKGLFCLVVDIVSIVTSGRAQSSASHPGPLFVTTTVPQSLCQKRTYVGFDGPFSLTHGCVLEGMQLNALLWCLGFGVSFYSLL